MERFRAVRNLAENVLEERPREVQSPLLSLFSLFLTATPASVGKKTLAGLNFSFALIVFSCARLCGDQSRYGVGACLPAFPSR